MSFKDIRAALISLDESKLTLEAISSLIRFAPTKEEIHLLLAYEDKTKLGNAEKFFLEIYDLPRYVARLECWEFKLDFKNVIEELKPQIKALTSASVQLQTSQKFARLLEVVLALGNYINGGSFRGSAYGFSFDCLLKLGDTKTVDNHKTLMHYLSQLMQSKFTEIQDFFTELPDVTQASKGKSRRQW
jgi:hypothetical protein